MKTNTKDLRDKVKITLLKWDKKINLILPLCTIFLILTSCNHTEELQTASPNYLKYVNPFIGTGATGHTFPGATYPLGLIQLSPDTGNEHWDYCSGYQFNDTTVRGFSHSHLSGGGGPDLGDVCMLPFMSEEFMLEKKPAFSKEREKASPGYYETYLTTDNIKVELTVSERTGVHRYIFNEPGNQKVLVNIDKVLSAGNPKTHDASFNLEGNQSVSGSYISKIRVPREVYFVVSFDQPFISTSFPEESNKKILTLDFGENQHDTITARISISMVSIESARANLNKESIGKSFDQIHHEAKEEWNKYLSIFSVEGTNKQMELFYTSLYHVFIQPNNMTDVDGYYRGGDGNVYQSGSGDFYSTFPFWDTYRGAHPLYSIIIPEKSAEFVNSILKHYDHLGYLPVWAFWGRDSKSMIGNHAVPVIVDACLKDLPGIDKEKAFIAIKESLTKNHWRKYDWTIYDMYGYLPSDIVDAEAVSRTLEAAFDDWCAAQLAKQLGKVQDYDFFIKRAGYYKNLFDSDSGFMRGKKSDGSWVKPFNPIEITHSGTSNGDYTEANAWQYTWSVQHDVEGLIELFGDETSFAQKLDSLFILDPVILGKGFTGDVSGLIGQYAHGNEPSQHIAYLHNYVGQPYRTQELIKQILESMYDPTPVGICGNVDYGQMSAWYILNSLGFYPVNPASGYFDLSRPAFENAKIRLGDNYLEIKAKNFSNENDYVKSVTLNGKQIDSYKLSYEEIMGGGELIFEMTSEPDRDGFLNGIGVCASFKNADMVKQSEFTFIEENVGRFLVPDKSDDEFNKILEEAKKSSLQVIACNSLIPGNLKSVGPDAVHDSILSYMETVFHRAQKAGVETIVFGSGGSRSIPDDFPKEKARRQFIDLCSAMAPIAAKYDVVVVLEPLNTKECNFINSVAEGGEIVKEVNHPNFKLLADIYHMLMENEGPESIIQYGDFIKHVHIAEKEGRAAPGTTNENFRPYFEAMKQANYTGRLSIECKWGDLESQADWAFKSITIQLNTL